MVGSLHAETPLAGRYVVCYLGRYVVCYKARKGGIFACWNSIGSSVDMWCDIRLRRVGYLHAGTPLSAW